MYSNFPKSYKEPLVLPKNYKNGQTRGKTVFISLEWKQIIKVTHPKFEIL